MQVPGLRCRWVEHWESQFKRIQPNQKLKACSLLMMRDNKAKAAPFPTSHDKGPSPKAGSLASGKLCHDQAEHPDHTILGCFRISRDRRATEASYSCYLFLFHIVLSSLISSKTWICLWVSLAISLLIHIFSFIYKTGYFTPKKGNQSHRQGGLGKMSPQNSVLRVLDARLVPQEAAPLKVS